jgi:hypothetical protein
LKRIYVLFFISLERRRIELVACTANPTGAWVAQQARNLLMNLDDREQPVRFLIHDRDSKFSGAFDQVFTSEGVTVIRTPVRAPNANAHAERWVGSARRGASTGCSSSAAANSRTCFMPIRTITTGIGRIGHSHFARPSRQTQTQHRSERDPICS